MSVNSHLQIGVLAPLFPPAFRGGGPIRSIQAMVDSAPDWAEVSVVTADQDLGASTPLDVPANVWVRRARCSVRYTTMASPSRYLSAMISLRVKRPDLLHMNSFFNHSTTIVPLLLWRIGFWGRPVLLVAPRGEFGPAALKRHAWRKRIYIALFRLLRGPRAVTWHSTAPHESDAIRALWGGAAHIIERGNETLLPPAALSPADRIPGPIRLVFLGRIVEHKGLHIALEALREVDGEVSLDVFGLREDEKYYEECRAMARSLPLCVRVTFHEAVPPEGVRGVLHKFDALLMPTAGENFGHVVAEALSASCMVIITPSTPWNEVVSGGGGVLAEDRSVGTWSTILRALSRMDDGALVEGRLMAGQSYASWQARPREAHVWAQALGIAEGQAQGMTECGSK